MTNHYHLEVETREPHLSRGLQWLNHVYAAHTNWRHERAGHLFQGRFKSALVEAETHLHLLTRYIHMNPVRAGLTADPTDYAWSSYRAYLGLDRPPQWLQIGETLARFGKNRAEQVREYRRFVEGERAEDPLRSLSFGAVVGGARFVNWVREKLLTRKADRNVSRLLKALPRPSPADISVAVSRVYGTVATEMRRPGRKGHEARDVAIYLSRELSGTGNSEIGEYYGGVGAAAVSLACARAERRAADDARFAKKLSELKERAAASTGNIKD
jgi:hypothetical protein